MKKERENDGQKERGIFDKGERNMHPWDASQQKGKREKERWSKREIR